MANTASKTILKALIEGVVTELMVKTTGDMVYIDDTTNVSAKIAEMVSAINARAKTTDVTAAIEELRAEVMGEGVPEAYDTFKEICDYISEHEDIVTAINAAIGNKADKTALTTLENTFWSSINGLGSLAKKSSVSESDLDAALVSKVNAAAEGNHSHANAAVLAGITADLVSDWNGKSNVYFNASQPSDLAQGDLWVQLVE